MSALPVLVTLPGPLARALGVVWNHAERRPRMPLRVVVWLVVLAVVSAIAGAGGRLLADAVGARGLRTAGLGADLGVVGALASALAATVAVCGTAVAVDRRRVADLGLGLDRGWWLDCAFGTVLGIGLQAAILVVGLAAGWFRVVGVGYAPAGSFAGLAGAYLVVFACVSVSEELAVRGYLLTNLAEGLAGLSVPGLGRLGALPGRAAVLLATLATSGLFGLLHAANPNATALSTATIALAGVFLAAGYVLAGELAVPLGIHLGWNYAQGVLLGFPVSGIRLGVAALRTRETGPDVVTGGAFGPEAGLLGVGAVLLGTALVALWVREREGGLALDPAVWTPALRWRPRGAGDGERGDGAENAGGGGARSENEAAGSDASDGEAVERSDPPGA